VKHKILIRIEVRGPLKHISKTMSGPRSKLWESLL
jgi:hypothetical protein